MSASHADIKGTKSVRELREDRSFTFPSNNREIKVDPHDV